MRAAPIVQSDRDAHRRSDGHQLRPRLPCPIVGIGEHLDGGRRQLRLFQHALDQLGRQVVGANVAEATLFGVGPADPLTLGGMVIVVIAITLVTCWIPARRATRVEPLAALRNE